MKVINASGNSSIAGRLVKVNPVQKNSFALLGSNEQQMLGVCAQTGISNGMPCEIQTSGTALVFVNGNCKQGDIIRSLISGDSGTRGTARVLSLSDQIYLKIGTALTSGYNALIAVSLSSEYIQVSSVTPGSEDHGSLSGLGDDDHPQYALLSKTISEEFESVSKNLKSYPYVITYDGDDINYITYNLGGGNSIVKTFNYTLGILTSIVLSEDTPLGIFLTKTFNYTEGNLTNVTYS